MHVLRLLAARRPRRSVSTITAAVAPQMSEIPDSEAEEDEGPFFDLDFSSVRASSSSGAASGSESDDACTELDFIISLQRSRSASPSYETLFFGGHPQPLKFCASELSSKASLQAQYGGKRGSNLRRLSFGTKKAAFYGGRPSFALSSSSARTLRLFMESPAGEDEEVTESRRAPSGDVFRRYLTKISRRFRSVRPRAAGEARGLRRLRKSRSASAAVTLAASRSLLPSRRDDSLIEQQDGIASAIAHCKESLHRASTSECDSSLLRSRSDPGKCEAA
ncbi:membrane-associated kinase regulator 5-like [Phragmites australis]|uniref:membrane-associated kinase regulator 5-like n=1 Tax=Phragmites australis TaxID=29695 RepID=UPI002D77C3E7|nr:membrane-associated kinase regulator 5-like [Phragmites australis]